MFAFGWDREQWKIAETYYNMMNKDKAISIRFCRFEVETNPKPFCEVQDFWRKNKSREPTVLPKMFDLSQIAPWRM